MIFRHYKHLRLHSKLGFLDDGWDTDEIWNLVVGDTSNSSGVDPDTGQLIENYIGTDGQDVLMADIVQSNLYGGDGKDILIGDNYGSKTVFELGNKDGDWDQIADVIQGFGDNDQIDLSTLGIADASSLTADGNSLTTQVGDKTVTIVEFKDFNDGLTLDQLLTEDGAIIYGAS